MRIKIGPLQRITGDPGQGELDFIKCEMGLETNFVNVIKKMMTRKVIAT